ncbi:MAG: hypothetical protein R3A52_05305 [Polyangiales bacterium]
MTRSVRWVPLALLLGACGDDSNAPSDAGALTDVASDVAAETDAGADAAACDLGDPPTTPTFTGAVRIAGGDAGAVIPTPSGGDPEGRWVADGATLWFPEVARGQLDESGSELSGVAWGDFSAGRYRLLSDLVIRVNTVMAGPVPRPSRLGGRGAFTVQGERLTLTPECTTMSGTLGMGAMAGPSGFAFSRDAADRARLFVYLGAAPLQAALIFDLRRVQ